MHVTPHSVIAAAAAALMTLAASGCSGSGRAEPIGAILTLTGDAAVYGVPPRNGIELAADQINAGGGVRGKLLSLHIEDDGCNPTSGVSAALKLITTEHVPVIIGAICSSVTLAIAPIADREHVVLFSPQSSAPAITNAGDYVFRNWPSDAIEGKLGAEFAFRQLHAKTAAVLYITNDYGVGISQVFRSQFVALGGKVLRADGFAAGTMDFRTQLAVLRSEKPDVVYLASYLTEGSRVLVQAAEMGLRVPFIGPIGLLDPELFKLAGRAADGLYVSAPAYDTGSADSNVKAFVTAYRARFGSTPNAFAAAGYDAMKILALVMTQRGFSSDSIKAGLYAVHDYPGVSGMTSFDSNGDVVRPARMLVARHGAFVPVPMSVSSPASASR